MQKITSYLNNFLFFLVIFLIAFIPLYPKFPLLNIKGTFVAIRLEDLFIALTLFLWAAQLILSGRIKPFFKDKLNQAILLFLLIGIFSVFSGVFLTSSVVPHLSLLHFLRRVELLMLLPVCTSVISSKRKFIWVLIVITAVVLFVNGYGIGQLYLGWPVISTTNSEFSKGLFLSLSPGARINSTFAGHYDLAVFLAMILSVFTAVFFGVKKRIRIVIAILGVISFFVLIMTSARLSFVAALVGVIVSLILAKKRKYILLLVVFVMIFLIYPSQLRERLISTITVNLFSQGQRYVGRTQDQQIRGKLNIPTLAIQTSSTSAKTSVFATQSGIATDIAPGEPVDTTDLGVYRSLQIRLNIEWPRALKAFIKNPFLGTGYSSIDIATDNDFLRSLGEVGILGTISLALVLIEIAKRISRLLKSNDKFLRFFSAGILSMSLAFLVNGLFIDVFEASKVASLFWMVLGINLAVLNFKHD